MAISLTELREQIRRLQAASDPERIDDIEAAVADLEADLAALDDRTPRILGLARGTTAQASIGASATDLTGFAVTATVAANRRIRITASGRVTQQTAIGTQQITLVFDGGNVAVPFSQQMAINGIAAYGFVTVQLAPAAGSHTWKLAASTSGGTMTHALSAVIPGLLLVEDIGPN